jgi:hypothetical protein
VGVNVISNEQVHARRAGCECPRMTFGRRIEVAGISGGLSEAARGSSKQVHTHSVGCARPRAVFGRRIEGLGFAESFAETAKIRQLKKAEEMAQ